MIRLVNYKNKTEGNGQEQLMLFFAVTIYLHNGTVEGKCYICICICIQCIQNLTNPGLYSHVSIGAIYFPNSK